MTVQWVHRVFEHSALERTQYLFMIALANDADNDGVSIISAQTLANHIHTKIDPKTGQRSTRNIYRLVNAAEAAGEIFVWRDTGIENTYVICLKRPASEIVEVLTRRLSLDSHTAGLVAEEKLGAQKLTSDKLAVVTSDNLAVDLRQDVTGTSDNLAVVKRENGRLPIKDLINIRETDEYEEMLTAVVMVTRFLDPIAVEEPDRARIEVLVRNGVTPAEVREYYSQEDGSWWRSYWKGKQGQRPTTKDIVETILQAREGAEFASAEAEFTAAWKSVQDYLKGRVEFGQLIPRAQEMVRHFKESVLRQATKPQMTQYRKQALAIWTKGTKEVDRT